MDPDWLTDAERRIRAAPGVVRVLFPAVGRSIGRGPLRPGTDPDGLVHGTVDDAGRARLLGALADVLSGSELGPEVADLYHHGDRAERRGVLRGLPTLPPSAVPTGTALVEDALRTNDPALLAAALGEFAAAHLEQHQWRHGVLKCVFNAVPLVAVAGLHRRTDDEFIRMVRDHVAERRAAGREICPDVLALSKARLTR